MLLKPGVLGRIKEGTLPAWTIPPTPRNIDFNTLVGTLVESDVFVVIESRKNGTLRCLSRLGIVEIVTAFVVPAS
jgi:hypothetical protein